jgi:hypothetical protein
MATAIRSLNRLQFGLESTKGTIVAATKIIRGNWIAGFTEEYDTYRSPYPSGVLANVGGAGVFVRKGVTLKGEFDLSAEQALWPLTTGILGAVSPSNSDTTAYTYTYTPQLTTAIRTLDTLTGEFIMGDGSTNHVAREAGYGFCTQFSCKWATNQQATMSAEWVLRASQTSTPTGSLAAYTSLEPLVTNLLSVYLDTSWAGLGGTQLTTIVRSAELDVMTGLAPDYTLDGRSDLDFTQHKVGPFTAKLKMMLELNATAASRVANFRANDIVFIRLKNIGSLAGAATAYKTFQADGAYRFVSPPAFSEDGEQVLVGLDLESVYDTTGAKTLEFVVINKLATVEAA